MENSKKLLQKYQTLFPVQGLEVIEIKLRGLNTKASAWASFASRLVDHDILGHSFKQKGKNRSKNYKLNCDYSDSLYTANRSNR